MRIKVDELKSDDKKVTIKLTNKKAIIQFLTENVQGKNSDFANLLNVKSTRVKQIIYELIDEDIVVVEGANRNRTYRLKF